MRVEVTKEPGVRGQVMAVATSDDRCKSCCEFQLLPHKCYTHSYASYPRVRLQNSAQRRYARFEKLISFSTSPLFSSDDFNFAEIYKRGNNSKTEGPLGENVCIAGDPVVITS